MSMTPPPGVPQEPPTDPEQTNEADPDAGSNTSPGLKSWVTAGVAAVVIVIGGLFVASRGGSAEPADNIAAQSAQQAPGNSGGQAIDPGRAPGGLGGQGQVSSIEGTTLVLDTQDRNGEAGSLKVTTTDETVVREVVSGSVDDLSVGDSVVIAGEETDSGITADSISEVSGDRVGPGGGGAPPSGIERPTDGGLPGGSGVPDGVQPPGGTDVPGPGGAPNGGPGNQGGGFSAGEITAIDGDTLTVSALDGSEVEVIATGDTEVTVTVERSFGDIEVGDSVRAQGEIDGDTVAASAISIGGLSERGGPGGQPRNNAPDAPSAD